MGRIVTFVVPIRAIGAARSYRSTTKCTSSGYTSVPTRLQWRSGMNFLCVRVRDRVRERRGKGYANLRKEKNSGYVVRIVRRHLAPGNQKKEHGT